MASDALLQLKGPLGGTQLARLASEFAGAAPASETLDDAAFDSCYAVLSAVAVERERRMHGEAASQGPVVRGSDPRFEAAFQAAVAAPLEPADLAALFRSISRVMASRRGSGVTNAPECIDAYVAAATREQGDGLVADAAAKCLVNSLVASPASQKLVAANPAAMDRIMASLRHSRTAEGMTCIVRALLHMAHHAAPAVHAPVVGRADLPRDMLLLLASTLRQPRDGAPFPHGAHRASLLLDGLKLLYVVLARAAAPIDQLCDEDTLTQYGFLFAELLKLRPVGGPAAQDVLAVQTEATHILLHMPPSYSHFLHAAGCTRALLRLARLHLLAVHVEGEKPTLTLEPTLGVLCTLARESAAAKQALREAVFNPRFERPAQGEDEAEEGRAPPEAAALSASGAAKARQAAGRPYRRDSTPALLVKTMTSMAPRSKRFACELAFELLDRDEKQLIEHAGSGSALPFVMAQQGSA